MRELRLFLYDIIIIFQMICVIVIIIYLTSWQIYHIILIIMAILHQLIL